MLKNLDDGNRVEFLRLWSQHVPSTVIDSDPSLKSLEFLIYAHFAIYYLRPNNPNKVDFIDERKTKYIYSSRMKKLRKKICKSLKFIWNQSKDRQFHKRARFYRYLPYHLSLHRINMHHFKIYFLFVDFHYEYRRMLLFNSRMNGQCNYVKKSRIFSIGFSPIDHYHDSWNYCKMVNVHHMY